ncbi:GNAT family N-acetyltransferase [Thioalkalivibrio sp. XN8]|uniref:GNAT family N-acetyltransferase n=1 Tax=Thioalkalivibrio sp. XN8 TaxID=2712863 RepID=UPI0013EBDA9A|nr:GNAT family N-acetyltransferase [Thioalkalivibrio sp. XN8]NGP53515.1 GNAT family N-acetyltransferase [Thioalkalivibrio sp. XN8]
MAKSKLGAADFRLRKAAPADGPVLAELLNAAGEGLPLHLWSLMAGPGEDPMAVGARRAAGTEGGFSHRHAHVAMVDERVAGMLLGYPLPDPCDTSGLAAAPPVVRPLLELEARAPGSWYVNAVAALPQFRGRGVGTFLMNIAEFLARAAGAPATSLVVAEDNAGAMRLYQRLGYEVLDRRPVARFPGCHHTGDWLLMCKNLRRPATDGAG